MGRVPAARRAETGPVQRGVLQGSTETGAGLTLRIGGMYGAMSEVYR